jgi:signal transduction histidine kinase
VHRTEPSILPRAAVATSAVCAALVATWAVRLLAADTLYIFFVAAVGVASWVGGLPFGVAAVGMSIVAVDVAFIEPVGSFGIPPMAPLVRLVSFALVGTLIAGLTSALASATLRAERLAAAAADAKNAAEAASKAKSDFLATLSHEVRTPINALLGYADLLENGAAGPMLDEQARFIRRLRQAAHHLLRVVNEVLEMAKTDSGHLTLDMRAAPVSPIIDDAISLVMPLARAKEITVATGGESADAWLYADVDRVREILVNLLGNAIKFAPRGSAVEITTGRGGNDRGSPHAHASPTVWICVTDHGPGVSAEDQARIFEPFEQASNGRDQAKLGTGLGLAISRRLARLMGGELELTDRREPGASFTLWVRTA